MLGRSQLIEILAHLAAPLTPFTLEGAPEDEGQFIDWVEQRSRSQFARIQDDAVAAFIDLVIHPPAPAEYIPPASDLASFKQELLGLAEFYSETPHAQQIA